MFRSATDVIVALGVCFVAILVLFPMATRSREVSCRTACAANLHGIYQSMYTYATASRNDFPIYGNNAPEGGGVAIGFRYKDRTRTEVPADHPDLRASATASLWVMIREASASVRQFVCPTSDQEPDWLLDDSGEFVNLDQTFDFASETNLSYSMLNMYGSIQRRQWGGNVAADRILMGDNNNAMGPMESRHRTTKNSDASQLTPKALAQNENSQNHWSEAQNFLYGDGHATLSTDPFQGRSGDNTYAADSSAKVNDPEIAAPPVLDLWQVTHENGWPNFRRDSMLLPLPDLAGSNFGTRGGTRPVRRHARTFFYIVMGGFLVAVGLIWVRNRMSSDPA